MVIILDPLLYGASRNCIVQYGLVKVLVSLSHWNKLSCLALCPLKHVTCPELLDFVLNLVVLEMMLRLPQEA